MRDLKKIIQRHIGMKVSKHAADTAASICNRETFAPLKNLYHGREIVVCGAGPSLSKYHPVDGAIHIALNRALLFKKVKYDYFIADDWVGINFMQKEIIEYDCEKYMGYHFGNLSSREIPESFRIESNAKKYYTDSFLFPRQRLTRLIVDIDMMAISNQLNMGLQVMQIVLFMNPSRIYLVGMDSVSNGHFAQNDLTDSRLEIEQDLKKYVDIGRAKEKWDSIKEFAEVHYPNTEIVSINPVGLKGIFRDVYQDN